MSVYPAGVDQMNRGHKLPIRNDAREAGLLGTEPPALLFMPPQSFALPRHPTRASCRPHSSCRLGSRVRYSMRR